ncbi:hypothetical protein GCM10020256_51820 [Streptomyces thermocoprophilus]|jgi:hypothetical protein
MMAPRQQGSTLSPLQREPAPVPGCSECLRLANRRQNARSESDHSAVTDANVYLRRHLKAQHGEG